MSIEGIDYAWGRISGHVLKAAGFSFVCRYLSRDPSKNLSAPEAVGLHAAGLAIVLVWEQAGQAALGGYQQGRIDATTAQGQAAKLGVPSHVPIYFAVDFPLELSQAPAVAAYFKGVEDVLGYGRTGVYGGLVTIQNVLGKHAAYGWQTYAWSGGVVHPGAQLYQYSNDHTVGGVSCDFNRALHADFGQWEPAASERPRGIARFAGEVDLSAGRWEVEGRSNTIADRVHGELAHFGPHGGHWSIESLPPEPGDIWAAKVTIRRGDPAA